MTKTLTAGLTRFALGVAATAITVAATLGVLTWASQMLIERVGAL